MELVDVPAPHIGGPTDFFQWRDDELVVVADVNGDTSHLIGSRNLDMNAAGYFDESNQLMVLYSPIKPVLNWVAFNMGLMGLSLAGHCLFLRD